MVTKAISIETCNYDWNKLSRFIHVSVGRSIHLCKYETVWRKVEKCSISDLTQQLLVALRADGFNQR